MAGFQIEGLVAVRLASTRLSKAASSNHSLRVFQIGVWKPRIVAGSRLWIQSSQRRTSCLFGEISLVSPINVRSPQPTDRMKTIPADKANSDAADPSEPIKALENATITNSMVVAKVITCFVVSRAASKATFTCSSIVATNRARCVETCFLSSQICPRLLRVNPRVVPRIPER